MRRAAFAGLVLVLGLLGSADALGKEKLRFAKADMAAARATLVRQAELVPAGGWKGGPTTPDFGNLDCDGFHARDADLIVTGAAESVWSRDARSLDAAVDVYLSAKMARLDFTRNMTAAGVECAMSEDGGPHVHVSVLDPVPWTRVFTARFRYSGQDVVMAYVVVAKGRTEIHSLVLDLGSVPKGTVLAEALGYSGKMARRARA